MTRPKPPDVYPTYRVQLMACPRCNKVTSKWILSAGNKVIEVDNGRK